MQSLIHFSAVPCCKECNNKTKKSYIKEFYFFYTVHSMFLSQNEQHKSEPQTDKNAEGYDMLISCGLLLLSVLSFF